MRGIGTLAVSLSTLLGIQSASAVLLTFDDLPEALTALGTITNGYGGVNWNGAKYYNKKVQYLPNGYVYGVVSGFQAAQSSSMSPIVIEGMNGSSFNLTSAYVTAVQNPHYITIKGYNGSNPIPVYSRTDWVLCTNKSFLFNFANVTKVVIDPVDPNDPYSTFNNIVLDNVTVTKGLGGPPAVDADADGVPDAEDAFPNSRDVGTTVTIDGCDTGVPSMLFPDGSTISDLVYEIAEEAENHGQFVSGVAQLKNQLRKDAVLTAAQAAAIQECAARSSLP